MNTPFRPLPGLVWSVWVALAGLSTPARAETLTPTAMAATEAAHPVETAADATAAQSSPTGTPSVAAAPPMWQTHGEARLRSEAMPSFGLDAKGTPSARELWWLSRLVAGARWRLAPTLVVDLELEALNGWLGGDATGLGTAYTERPFLQARDGRGDLARVLPRKAMVTWTSPIGQLLVGAQTFQWGAGMLAADGNQDNDFGDGWQGNIVARAAFATRPLAGTRLAPLWRNLTVFVGADLVVRDDNASLLDGDEAKAAVLGVRASDETLSWGLLVAARDQTDRDDPWRPGEARAETQVLVTDLWAKWLRRWASSTLTLEGEAAWVNGTSTRPWSDETVAVVSGAAVSGATGRTGGAKVNQLGALARLRFEHQPSATTWKLELGYASGDNDIRDATARQFAMHSDHNVGLVLFDQVLPLMQARSIDRLADPGLVAVRPPGARFAVHAGGQVANALYLHPVLRWRPLPPLDLRLGYVLAAAAADVADSYQTAIHGGFATTPGGVVQGPGSQAGRTYGHELDLRATWDLGLLDTLTLRFGAEAGVLIPGSALSGVAGLGTPWLARGLASLLW
jgi:hypothetical protein